MKILVYGFYDQGNLGDELFKNCFTLLFPEFELDFSSTIPSNSESDYNALWIGGGGLLQDEPHNALLALSRKLPVGIIGVDRPAKIHRYWEDIESRALVKLYRFQNCPDLHFCMPSVAKTHARQWRPSTVFMNSHIHPAWKSESWKVAAHNWFRHEFPQCLEELGKKGFVNFFPMSEGSWSDEYAACEFFNLVDWKTRERMFLLKQTETGLKEAWLNSILMESRTVVSLRLHGAITALRFGIAPLCISASDKISNFCKDVGLPYVNYFGFQKNAFFATMEQLKEFPTEKIQAYTEKARAQWQSLSVMIKEKFV